MTTEEREATKKTINKLYNKYYSKDEKQIKRELKAKKKKEGGKINKFKGILSSGSHTKEALIKFSGVSEKAFYSILWSLKKKGLEVVKKENKYSLK